MADFQNSFSLEDAMTDNPPETEPEIKRDFISSLEAEPYDDVVGETCGKSDYIPLLDDDTAKCGNEQKADGVERAASSQPLVLENGDRGTEEHFGKEPLGGAEGERKMYSEFVAQKEPWQLEQELCFEPHPLFPPIKQPDPFEANRGDDLLSDLILLPSCEMKSRPAFTEHFGAAGDLPAPPNNATYEDDWLQVDQCHAEETEDLKDLSGKTAGTPRDGLSERSPWEAVSFPVDAVDDHTRSHWQPTILEQQKLGMHHAAEPSRPAEFTLLEASVAAGTSAELAGAAEFPDWQHAQPPVNEAAETPAYPGPMIEFLAFDDAAAPEEEGTVEKLCFPPKNSPEESEVETEEYDAIVFPRGPGDAMERFASQQDVNTQHKIYEVILEPTELLEHLKNRQESITCGAVAVPVTSEAAEGEPLPPPSSVKESIPNLVVFEVATLPLGTDDESLLQQNFHAESHSEDLGFGMVTVGAERSWELWQQESEHPKDHQAGEPSAPTLAQDGGGHPVERPALNLSGFQADAHEINPFLGQPSDPPTAPAGDVLMELKFEETRAPADGACAIEVEKHLADTGGHPEPLHAWAGEVFEEQKTDLSEASAPAVFSPFEGQNPPVEAGEVHRTEDFILDASVISQTSPSIEAIAGSITSAPSKVLPPSPDKKVKASASAKPAAAKGRPTSVSSPKQSTPPPGKKAASPAPVASSTPKRPTSSSARTSTLTPKDSNTPRSSTLSPKEMKPKGLDLKSPVKSPEKKTPLSKQASTPTSRPTSKTPVGTPKGAMVPAVAVASTTGSASKSTTSAPPRRPTTIKTEAKPVDAKKTTNVKSADPSRPRTAPANAGKSNATTPSSPSTNSAPGAPISRTKPSKPPAAKPIPESNATGEKKLAAAKAPVSKANVAPKVPRPVTVAAPDLKNVRSKIGSTDNMKHQPGGGRANIEKKTVPVGLPRKPAAPLPVTKTATTKTTVSKETAQKDTNGKVAKSVPASKTQPSSAAKPRPGSTNVQILNKKVDTSKVSSKCGSKANIKHKPGGGDVKIESHKNIPKDKVQAKVGSLDNMGHVPAGGKVKSEGSEEAGDLIQTPQNGDLSTPQSLAGSETQQNGVPSEGSDQREIQNLDNQIQETSI